MLFWQFLSETVHEMASQVVRVVSRCDEANETQHLSKLICTYLSTCKYYYFNYTVIKLKNKQ